MDLSKRIKAELLKKPFDLVIIGGGINGAAVARDASERGLRVLLLEKEDYAYGCSSHSTRLIHGGLRYLEHLEFNLVKESLDERETLLNNYPNLVHPLELVIPAYQYSRNGLWKLKAGMMLYDMLSANKSMPKHKSINREELKDMNLHFNPQGLKGAVSYFDGQSCFVERICLENILTAEQSGAICLNHCEVTEVQVKTLNDDNSFTNDYKKNKSKKVQAHYRVTGLRFKDKLNGNVPYTVEARNVLNMAGPGVDIINEHIKQNDNFYPTHPRPRLMGGTKGSHIVVEEFPGAPRDKGVYVEAKSDGRPFFILPFKLGANKELYLIGTTDIYLNENEMKDPYSVEINEKEITYLLQETNNIFPQAKLVKKDVIKTFCGVRPLPYVADKTNPGAITRKHFIYQHNNDLKGIQNYYSIVGGKITTFRSLAKEIVDMFSSEDCNSSSSPTLGCDFEELSFTEYLKIKLTELLTRYPKLDVSTVMHLIMLYGSRAEEVLRLTIQDPELIKRIDPDFEDIEAQIIYAIRYEQAYTVEDIVRRRLSIGLSLNKIPLHISNTIKNHLNQETELNKRRIKNF